MLPVLYAWIEVSTFLILIGIENHVAQQMDISLSLMIHQPVSTSCIMETRKTNSFDLLHIQ